MIEIENILVSKEVFNNDFVCNISKCKGACCIEGDLGAPLKEEELAVLDDIYDEVAPYLDSIAREKIEEEGKYVLDFEDEYSTPTIDGKECAYAVYDEGGVLQCAIEQAHNDGKIDFKKPISCHLYPIRTVKLSIGEALNYDKWDICSDACELGKSLNVPVYKFLKEPLIRKYGEGWYKKLELATQQD